MFKEMDELKSVFPSIYCMMFSYVRTNQKLVESIVHFKDCIFVQIQQ